MKKAPEPFHLHSKKWLVLTTATLVLFSAAELWAMAKMPPKPTSSLPPAESSLPGDKTSYATSDPNVRSLTIADCYRLALKRSETVAIKKEEIARTEADFLQAASVALGDIDFTMTDFYQDPQKSSGGGSSIASTYTAYERRERKFLLKQPLFQGFKSIGAILGAGSLRQQRKEEWTRAQQLLFLDVARAFYDVLQAQKDVEAIQEIIKQYEERIKELKSREQVGRSRPSEVVNAESQMKIFAGDLAQSKGLVEINQHILEFLVGIPVDPARLTEETLETEIRKTLREYVDEIDERADVEAKKQAVKVAWQAIVVAQSGFWPTLSLENNNYVKREGFQSGIDWDVLLKMDVPLFTGGETLAQVKYAINDLKEAKLNYSLAWRSAELEVKKSYAYWVSAEEKREAYIEAVKSAEENYQLQRDEYSRSLVNNLDVLAALNSLVQTRRDANIATYQAKKAYWDLQVSVGKILPEAETTNG